MKILHLFLQGYSLNIWDVGGQKSLRSYWRNYFETTDGLIWVVDSADRRRLADCKAELHQLLQEEVCLVQYLFSCPIDQLMFNTFLFKQLPAICTKSPDSKYSVKLGPRWQN